jgi:hypothetical protein
MRPQGNVTDALDVAVDGISILCMGEMLWLQYNCSVDMFCLRLLRGHLNNSRTESIPNTIIAKLHCLL